MCDDDDDDDDEGERAVAVRKHRSRGALAAALTVGTLLAAGGCTSAPSAPPSAGAPSAAASGSASSTGSAAAADAVNLDITIADGKVTPSGQKISAKVGQQVVMNVTTDEADEIHAHTGGDGYELEVPAGETTTGRFTLDQPGSFEVESHHLEKIIVILNVS